MTIGSFIGGGSDAAGALWVRINRDVPIIGHLGDVLELYASRWQSVAQQIEGALDLHTAVGHALDLWGVTLGVRRLGLADADYRRLLLVEAVLVLTGTSTRGKAIAVFERWTGVAAAEYRGDGRTIEIGGDVPTARRARLVRLMKRVAPAARRVRVYSVTGAEIVADDARTPTGTTTITDDARTPVTGAEPTAELIL